jgi:hypothetical protein
MSNLDTGYDGAGVSPVRRGENEESDDLAETILLLLQNLEPSRRI